MEMESMPLCRTCLSAENLDEIFTDYTEEQLLLVTGIKISPHDEKPQSVCASCRKLIDSALILRKQSSYADNMLKIDSKTITDDEFESNTGYSSEDISDNFIFDNNLPNTCQEKPIEKKEFMKSRKKNNNLKKSNVAHCSVKQKNRKKKKTNHQNIFDISADIIEDVLTNRIDTINAKSITNYALQEFVAAGKNHRSSKKSKQDTVSTDIETSQRKVKMENFETDFLDDILTNDVIIGKHNKDKDLNEIYRTKCKTESFNVDDYFNPILSKTTKSLDTIKKDNEIKTNLRDLLILKPNDTMSNNEIYNIIYKDMHVKEKQRNKKHQLIKKRDKLWDLAVKPIDKHGLIKCSICSKEFKFNYFCRHATTHFEAEFTCEVCGHKFSNVNTMRYHQQRKHGAERKHACQQCEYRAVFKDELVSNIKNHSAESPGEVTFSTEEPTACHKIPEGEKIDEIPRYIAKYIQSIIFKSPLAAGL